MVSLVEAAELPVGRGGSKAKEPVCRLRVFMEPWAVALGTRALGLVVATVARS